MAVNDIYRVVTYCSLSTQISQNVTHWRIFSEGAGPETPLVIATALSGEFAPAHKSVMTGASLFRGVGVSLVLPLPRQRQINFFGDVGVGSLAGDTLPPQIAALISFSSTKLTSGSGCLTRMYVPFVAESSCNSEGSMTGAAKILYDGLADVYNTIITAGDSTLKMVALDAFETPWDIATWNTKLAFSQQKRRSFMRHGDLIPA